MLKALNQSTYQILTDSTKEEIKVEEREQFSFEWHPFCYKPNVINHPYSSVTWTTYYVERNTCRKKVTMWNLINKIDTLGSIFYIWFYLFEIYQIKC